MKKLLSLILAVTLVLSAFALVGCGGVKGTVNVKYYNEGSIILAGLKSGTEEIGMLPEPAASLLEMQTPNTTWHRLNVQELYDSDTKAYPQAVLMAKTSLLNAYPEIVTYIENAITANVDWVKTNPQDAVAVFTQKFPTTSYNAPLKLSGKSVDGCNIYFQSALDAKQSVQNYIKDIREIDQDSANLVGDDFFYTPSEKNGTWDKDSISFYAPDGAPAISIAKFIYDNDDLGTGKTLNYNISSAGVIAPIMTDGTADLILLPVNKATLNYMNGNNTNNPYKLVSVITHGNFYIMSKTELKIEDLIDKKVAVPNMGNVPDWTFQSILKKNNLAISVVA